jgi:Tfp pilus assembly protein PilW
MELLIAMSITLVIAAMGSSLVAASFNIRARENQRTEALVDAQRALNVMTREIANAGFGLSDNGIVAAESNSTSIRVRANLNALLGETTSNSTTDRDEDIKYLLFSDPSNSYILRMDVNTAAQEMILANRVDSLVMRYYPDKVYYTTVVVPPTGVCDIASVRDVSNNPVAEVAQLANAKYVVISLCVNLPASGTPGSPGYQPASRVQLVSDTSLRNSDLINY